MKMFKAVPLRYVVLLTTMMLTACGGGGGDGEGNNNPPADDTPPPSLQQGVFLDSPVEGLNYISATTTGFTQADGSFEYREGDRLTFILFGQVIGSVNGASVVTPYSLDTANENPDYAVNVMRVLQTFDSSGTLADGIQLPDATNIPQMALNFNQNATDFGSDATVLNFVSNNTTATLVSEADALSHFATSIPNAGIAYTLNLATVASAQSSYTTSLCNNAVSYIDYTFSDTSVTFVGDDTFDSSPGNGDCNVGTGGAAEVDTYTTLASIDEVFGCGPVCSFADLNKVVEGTDADGRVFRSTFSHTPGSDVITTVKTILVEAGAPVPYSFTEVIQLNTADYTIDLTGQTAEATMHLTPCATHVTGSYSFTATGFTRNGVDSFTNCIPQAAESWSDTYVNNADFGLDCGPVCSFADLNKRVTGATDADGRTYDLFMTHKKNSKVIKAIKRVTAEQGSNPETFTPYSFEEKITLD